MKRIFEHIPRVERKIFVRTTMNEISLFFTFAPLSLAKKFKKLQPLDLDFGVIQIQSDNVEVGQGELITYKEKDILVTILPTSILVSIPALEYRDFETTAFVWKNLEGVMKALDIEPAAWAFTKGNRFVFTQPITLKSQKDEALKMILSSDYLSLASDKGLFFEESTDKTRLFSCRYEFQKYKEKDALAVKFMMATQKFPIDGLCSEVMETNKLMFDGWHWAMSKGMLNYLDQPKEDKR